MAQEEGARSTAAPAGAHVTGWFGSVRSVAVTLFQILDFCLLHQILRHMHESLN
jgi:hypothetical protein